MEDEQAFQPLSLEEQCMDKFVCMLEASIGPRNDEEQLSVIIEKLWWKDKFFFSEFLAQKLLKKMRNRGRYIDILLCLLKDSSNLRRVDLSSSDVSDVGLKCLKEHALVQLDVSACKYLTLNGLTHLLERQTTLQELRMSYLEFSDNDCAAFQYKCLIPLRNLRVLDVASCRLPSSFIIFECLREIVHLNLDETMFFDHSSEESYLFLNGIQNLTKMMFLDISYHEVESLSQLLLLKRTLTSLIMHDCRIDKDEIIGVVVKLENLQVLDISRDEEPMDSWKVTKEDFELLICLPKLTDLDISAVADFGQSAFECLHQRTEKLKFLGLAHTMACHCHNIPAEHISGSSGEQQIMTSLQKYTNRPKFIITALSDLAELHHEHLLEDLNAAIEMVVKTLGELLGNMNVVNNGSVLLYYLTGDGGLRFPVRNKLLNLIVSLMDSYPLNSNMQRTCCFVLINLKIPNDMGCHMEKIIHLLVEMARNLTDDQSTRISVTLLNSCVCRINLKQKESLGFLVVTTILEIIKSQLDQNKTGTILNGAWSTLWNITDETPPNSRIFLKNNGLELFHRCFSNNSSDMELIRNILGMIGNVVEVTELHPYLLKQEIVEPIYSLLFRAESDLETRYNVCGIICHLAGNTEAGWTLTQPTRQEALSKVETEVESWDITASRQMSYISFEPLLRLLNSSFPPQTHFWVVWAMRNFCHFDLPKYRDLVIKGGGIPILEQLARNSFTDPRAVLLAQDILSICKL